MSTPADAPTDAPGEAGEIPTPICDRAEFQACPENGQIELVVTAHTARRLERTIATLRDECADIQRRLLQYEDAERAAIEAEDAHRNSLEQYDAASTEGK